MKLFYKISNKLKIRQYLYNFLLVTLVTLVLSLQYFVQLNLQFVDYLQGSIPAREEIVIIAIDDLSLKKIGAWPWSREVWAKAFENFSKARPRVAGIDVLFLEERAGDEELNKELNETKFPVVFASKLSNDEVYKPVFSSSNIQAGFVNLSADIDSKIRKTDVYNVQGANCNLSFAFMVFWKYLYPKESFVCNVNYDQVTFAGRTYDKRMAFNYSNESFRQYSFYDLYTDNVKYSELKDKIVLFGSTAIDLKMNLSDDFTDVWGNKISGVKIHANIINSLLENRLQQDVPLSYYLSAVLIITTILLLFYNLFRSTLSDLALFAFAFAFLLIIGIALYDSGINWPFIQVSGALLVNYIFMVIYQYVAGQKENRFVKKAFSQYINPVILKKIMDNPKMLKLGGEDKHIAILFSDIRGFTSLCEGMKPEEVFKLTNEYLNLMSTIILKYNGTIDKYIGDEIMAFWNAPIDDKKAELNAVNSGMEMLARLAEFNLAKPPNKRIRIGIGINSGKAMVGNLGSNKRFDYTVIGDTINTGARLESLTKHYGVPFIVSGDVKSAYEKQGGSRCRFRLLDEVVVKGRVKSLKIYQPVLNTSENISLVENYEKAFALYQSGKFEQAVQILKHISSDAPSGVILNRIQTIKNLPSWNGVWLWDEK